MKEESWLMPPKVPRRERRVRIVAVKIAVRDLRPGDLFSEYDGEYWNQAMAGRVMPAALICTNDAEDMDIHNTSDFVYRLTIVKEGHEREERDAHRSVVIDPYAPPGVLK